VAIGSITLAFVKVILLSERSSVVSPSEIR